jgi:hypothetical protein
MEDWTPVPIGSPVVQNGTVGCHTTTKRTNRRQEQEFRMALKRVSFSGLGKRQGKMCKDVLGREPLCQMSESQVCGGGLGSKSSR